MAPRRYRRIGLCGFLLAMAGWSTAAVADDGDFWRRNTATGDWFGLGSLLQGEGITLGATEISEFLSDVAGGARRGSTYDGRLEMDLDLDLAKLADWPGATIHASAYQIHGRGRSGSYVGNLLDVSNIEAERTTRLFDLYLEQSLFGDRLSLRVGQIAADDEFIISPTAAVFLNSTFGWPAIASLDLPNGGPTYPLATPGARLRYAPTAAWSWQTAVTSGDPSGDRDAPDGQAHDASGLAFSTDQGVFVITEGSYAMPGDKGALSGAVKIGGWYDSLPPAGQPFADRGAPPVDPEGVGATLRRPGHWGVYGIVDATLYRPAGGDGHGLSGFLRLAGSPNDRDPAQFYADAGLTLQSPFAARPDDVAGLAFAWVEIGGRLDGVAAPVRDHEAVIELSYRAPVTPWWTVQPDLQYILHPGAGAIAANAAGDAVVIGVRTMVKF